MENLSHSRQPNKSSTTHSKKPCNGTNFMAKTTYDDVFGGPPKFGAPTLAPRVEDYSEIFGCFQSSRASSIPVLDLPVVDEEDVFFDVSSSGFDYNEVFGGYDALDSAISFEDLMMDQKDAVNADVDSSEEAWTPVETESFSEESDHSGKNKCLSNADSYESIDGTMEFNISYNKANKRSDGDMSNGITHVAELQAVPGFTFLVDKTTQLEKRYENPPVQVTDENNLHMDFSGGMMREKNLRKTMSQASSSSAGEQAFENGVKPQKRYARNSSLPNETFVTVSEISLRTQPSEVPPPCRPAPLFDVKKGGYGRLVKNSKPSGSEETGGDTSPPFFDVEVDASSSAAASAAAMKEAMEKAQAKLKTAKELLERKREGGQRRKSEKKDREGKLNGNIDGSSSLLNEGVHGTCGRQENGMKYSVREEKQKVMKTSKAVADSLEGEKLFNMNEKLVEKHRRPDKIDGAAEWIEETQFFELVRTDRSTFGQANSDEILVADAQTHEHTQKVKKGSMEAVECQQENYKKIKGNSEDHKLGENEKKLKVAKEASEQQESNGRSVASKATRKHKGHVKMLIVAQEVCEQGENEKNINVVRHLGDNEKKPTGSDELEKHENLKKFHRSENLFEGENAVRHLENELPLKETNRSKENSTRFKASHEQANNERRQGEASEQEQNEKKLKEAVEQVKLEERLKEALKQGENDKKKVAHEREESEKRMRDAVEQTDNEKRLKEENDKQRWASERGENARRLKVCEQEDNEKKQREGCEREENEKKLGEALDKEENDKKQKEASEREEIEKRLKEACEVELMEKKLKSASEAEDVKGTNMVQEQTRLDENDRKLKMAGGPHVYMEGEDLRASDKECMLIDNRKVQATQLAGQHEENSKTVQVTQRAFAHEENGKIQTENRDGETELGAVEFMNVLVDGELSGIAGGRSEHEAHKYTKKDVAEPLSQANIVRTRGESGAEIGSEENESAFEIDSDSKRQGKKCDDEWGQRESNIKQAHIDIHQKMNKDKFMPTHLVKESVQIGRNIEADQPSELEGKGNIQRTAHRVSASHAERNEKNFKESLTLEEKEAERIKRERELEKERLRSIEEEKEREREREKDRMAVDKAFLEAREKAYTDARERAERSAVERVTADARQRALAEARERLEKACAEVKEKSLAEKTSMEARLRAERAAVERATAEARERAVEKAMAERAAFEARERGSFPEKFSAASRSSAMRPNSSSNDVQDHKFQSAGSSNYSRYPYSSGYGASYNTNRTEGVEVESAQRCKARLERHQRTAERAAKALAEKNMRDLLAQREQTERNRLAETLDADVKRWSSGKEGNLRALLSTLQYILGPDSGWHPIPLTEVITSAAVKKAYRKATLCVHPDKLQQRGASIQQKYICEKVFDLLKEAWNKFNSEER